MSFAWSLCFAVIVLALIRLVGLLPPRRGIPTEAPGWEEVALQHQLSYGGTTIGGVYRGYPVFVRLLSRLVTRNHRTYYVFQTHYKVAVDGLPHVGVTHAHDAQIDASAPKMRGQIQEVSTANHAFDGSFNTYARDVSAVELLQRRGIPETIIELRDRGFIVELRGGELHACRDEFVERADAITADLDEILEAAGILQGKTHPGTFCSDPAIMRWYWAEQRGMEYDPTNGIIHGDAAGRSVKIHFGQRIPLTVVEAATAVNLDIRAKAPIPTHLAIPREAREAAERATSHGDEVHFLDVVRIRADRPLAMDEIELRLAAVIDAAAHVEEATRTY